MTIGNNTLDFYEIERPSFNYLRCAVCGEPHGIHHGEPISYSGRNSYASPASVRGDCIVIPFFCEFGCKWLLLIGQHKGMTLMEMEEITTPALVERPGPLTEDQIEEALVAMGRLKRRWTRGSGVDRAGIVCGHCGGEGCDDLCTDTRCQCGTGKLDLDVVTRLGDTL